MHPNTAFHWQDKAAMADFAASVGFGMLFLTTPNGPRVAHIPFVLTGDGAAQFHLAKGNAMATHLAGAEGLIVVNGPDAYISPDDYGLPDQVPTWNYLSIEMQGPVRRMEREGLIALLDDLSAQEEAKLTPKSPQKPEQWTRANMDPKRFEAMLGGIIGFEMEIRALRGTAKLGQNKPEAARIAVADALDARGRRAMAHVMRNAADFDTKGA